MTRPHAMKLPPLTLTPEGAMRRIGVEVEFAALSAEAGARQVAALFGGTVEREDPHRYHVRGARLGDFTCELDTQYAHRPYGDTPVPEAGEGGMAPLLLRFQDSFRELFGDVSAAVMPCEIVCPPIPLDRLPQLEPLIGALEEAGAVGTRASPFYGFGVQLNVEIAESGAAWILAMLKSYLLLSDWLRAVMRIDVTRRLVAFANPFPADYVALVADPDYAPDRDRLIDDYLRHNPTRNRELDMLPLFAWLDAERVRRVIDDPRIKPRPAFHYRLPDANFGQPGWGLLVEWGRWRVVERCAEDAALLAAMGAAYRTSRSRFGGHEWALRASEWVMTA
jgi:hypothetical protein